MLKFKVKIILFVLFGGIIFFLLQNIFIPKWYSHYDYDNPTEMVKGILETKVNPDVVFLGNSIMLFGVSPMEIYLDSGIKSYNASVPKQSLAVTFHFLKQIFENKTPKLIVLDASILFSKKGDYEVWRKTLDNMPMGLVKWNAIADYSESTGENIHDIVFPLLNYHSRWDELKQDDFSDFFRKRDYYTLGYSPRFNIAIAKHWSDAVEYMNKEAEVMSLDLFEDKEFFLAEEKYVVQNYSPAYSNNIPKYNIEYLKKIKKICEENNCDLLVIKIPSVNLINKFDTVWTRERYNLSKEVFMELQIEYMDFMYDDIIEIKWERDSYDKGTHLNYVGAKKISRHISEYIKEKYDIEEGKDEYYQNQLKEYLKIKSVLELQSEFNYQSYIDKLKEQDRYIIGITVYGEKLDEEKLNRLSELGFRSDFHRSNLKTFIGLKAGKVIDYEAISDRYMYRKSNISNTNYILYSNPYGQSDNMGVYIGRFNSKALDMQRDKITKYTLSKSFSEYNNIHNQSEEGIFINVYDPEFERMVDSVHFFVDEGFDNQFGYDGYRGYEVTMDYLKDLEDDLKR